MEYVLIYLLQTEMNKLLRRIFYFMNQTIYSNVFKFVGYLLLILCIVITYTMFRNVILRRCHWCWQIYLIKFQLHSLYHGNNNYFHLIRSEVENRWVKECFSFDEKVKCINVLIFAMLLSMLRAIKSGTFLR